MTNIQSNTQSGGEVKEEPNNTVMSQVDNGIEEPIELTAEEQMFCSLVAKGYSGTKAYRLAFPHKAHLKHNTVYTNVSKLLSKNEISTEVATRTETAARLARLAEHRIEDILVNDDSQRKGSKVAEVSMFMYEQANGKATQRMQLEAKHVLITYDLSGGEGGPVPQEVLDQLAD